MWQGRVSSTTQLSFGAIPTLSGESRNLLREASVAGLSVLCETLHGLCRVDSCRIGAPLLQPPNILEEKAQPLKMVDVVRCSVPGEAPDGKMTAVCNAQLLHTEWTPP